MSNDTKKFNLLHTSTNSALSDEQILFGAAFVCRTDRINPVEIIDMLGLADDLQELRRSRRHRKDEAAQEM